MTGLKVEKGVDNVLMELALKGYVDNLNNTLNMTKDDLIEILDAYQDYIEGLNKEIEKLELK